MAMNYELMEKAVTAAWEDRSLLKDGETVKAIETLIEEVDKGRLRAAEPTSAGWKVNDWVKKGVILYFPIRQMETI